MPIISALSTMASDSLPESVIKAHILQYLRLQGAFVWVNVSTGIYDPKIGKFRKRTANMLKGTSDILGIYKGRMLAVEVKAGSGKLSNDQEFFLEQVKHHGGIGIAAWSVDDVIEALKVL